MIRRIQNIQFLSGMCSRTPWSRPRQIISDQGHVRLWNPTWLVRLHRSYVVEEKRQLKVQHRHNRLL